MLEFEYLPRLALAIALFLFAHCEIVLYGFLAVVGRANVLRESGGFNPSNSAAVLIDSILRS